MSTECPECGSRVPPGGACRDNFDSLLALEANFLKAVGENAHFHAVAAYVLQHPDSMNYSNEALTSLQAALTDHLTGRKTNAELRTHIQNVFDGKKRIQTELGESVTTWQRNEWPITVTDVLTKEPDVETYRDRVRKWAESVQETLASSND